MIINSLENYIRKGLLLALAVTLCCVREYNPFEDIANAKMSVHDQTTFTDGQHITIFCPETLYLAPHVGEKIDSFNLNTHGNIYWTDTTVRKNSGFDKKYAFYISFKDTGLKDISITTYKTGSATSVDRQKIPLRVSSPLYQKPLTVYLGTPCTLFTEKIQNNTALYHWLFGSPFHFVSQLNSYPYTFFSAPDMLTCSLWTSVDVVLYGKDTTFSSCKVPFLAAIFDTIRPGITCTTSTGVGGKDTFFTADTAYIFSVLISDQGNTPIKNATINDKSFQEKILPNIYRTIFDSMNLHPKTDPLEATVAAEDKFTNKTVKTFWLYFDSTGQQINAVTITISTIDSQTVSTNQYLISGLIDNRTRDSLLLKIQINATDTQYTPLPVSPSSLGVRWDWSVKLKEGDNRIIISAIKKKDGVEKARRPLTIYLTQNSQDSIGPQINTIVFNNSIHYTDDTLYFPEDSAHLSVVAIDQNSAVAKVTVNTVLLEPDASYMKWSKRVGLSHFTNERLALIASDTKNNMTIKLVYAFQNKRPLLDKNGFTNQIMTPGQTWCDTIWYHDPENDPVIIRFVKLSPWTASEGKYLSFTPSPGDTGQDSIVFSLYDGRQYSTTFIWRYVVVDKSNKVIFSPAFIKNLPDTLHAQKDRLQDTLAAEKGTRPYRYSACLLPENILFLNMAKDSVLPSWKPGTADIGNHTLFLKVTDAGNTRDSLYHVIRVVPADLQVVSLSLSITPDTIKTIKDTINASTSPDGMEIILLYKILTKSAVKKRGMFHITILENGNTTSYETDDTSFVIRKKTKINAPVESITVIVKDKSGNPPATLTRFIRHPGGFIIPYGGVWYDAGVEGTVCNNSNTQCDPGDSVYYWKSMYPITVDSLTFTPPLSSPVPVFVTIPDKSIKFGASLSTYLENTRFKFSENYTNNTLFFVALLDTITSGSNYMLFSSYSASNGNSFGIGANTTGINANKIGIFQKNVQNITFNSLGVAIPSIKKWHVYTISSTLSQTRGTITIRIDGSTDFIIALSGLDRYAGSNIALGILKHKPDIISDAWPGSMAEFIMYPRILPADTIRMIEKHLASQYGIPIP